MLLFVREDAVIDRRWANGSPALPGEYLAWVKASDQGGNERFAVGRIRVERPENSSPSRSEDSKEDAIGLLPVQLSPPLGAASPLPPGEGQGEGLLQFGGGASTSQSTASQTAAFHSAGNQARTQNPKSQSDSLWWGATAAAAMGAFAAEALRRKKEREQEIEDYYRSRPVKVEAEGKGGRMTGNQIARAYQAAKNNFTAT